MKISLLFSLSMLYFGSTVYAQSEPDFQLRIPLHGQWIGRSRTGVATWVIFSDVTAKGNQLAAFAIAGPYWRYGQRNWVEILAGARRNQNNFVDPAFNFRMVNNTIPRVVIPFPFARFSVKKAALATVYQFQHHTPDFVRSYLVITF